MRLAILTSARCPIICTPWVNGAHSAALPTFLVDRRANGEAFVDERVIRLPRRFSRAVERTSRRLAGATLPAELAAELYAWRCPMPLIGRP